MRALRRIRASIAAQRRAEWTEWRERREERDEYAILAHEARVYVARDGRGRIIAYR